MDNLTEEEVLNNELYENASSRILKLNMKL